ncbi:MAG TPA: heat-inducible transcriptional repressor HrcA [Anaerolineaceae bacterium]|jgi:heat-inducible transcriptional repressor|nr:heat-inducible transcription repressor HrcA [Chloroflexota bacterium]HNS07544.1 heat-inducible transcriptional repressor HrcA [Anaerolineaceae bacterium]HNW13175.1 heat-inducible transcriptional repressor HrcA [Anaerolineaceae bacterium]HOE02044.1 heat-inducible transcriptional repressor HrcA [Anaerolineaceae bacterium]HQF68327.1 heat-inducible transcriptional repressor HrcA [Anaerolineaceae bacterium]
MTELTDRQRMLLSLVIHEYVRSANPVGSKHVVEQFNLDMSSATVRNELSTLTELGYLRQPHLSAGRVPTEDGYRLFVGNIVQETELPDSTRRTIAHQFYQMRQDVEGWTRLAASILAHQSRAASLVTAPHPEQSRFKHLELIAARGRQVLMVLVLMGGEIMQRFITLPEPVSQEQLSSAADRLNLIFSGQNIGEMSSDSSELVALEQEFYQIVLDEMEQADAMISGEVVLDGFTNVLAEPEFADSEEARRALRVLEEKTLLNDILSKTVLHGSSLGGVQVLIGGEGIYDALSQCSVVLARYGTPGLATGTLGVLGPMRMPYGRTISIVRFLSGLLSDLVNDTIIE